MVPWCPPRVFQRSWVERPPIETDQKRQRLRRVCVGGCQMWSARRLQGSRESLVPASGAHQPPTSMFKENLGTW